MPRTPQMRSNRLRQRSRRRAGLCAATLLLLLLVAGWALRGELLRLASAGGEGVQAAGRRLLACIPWLPGAVAGGASLAEVSTPAVAAVPPPAPAVVDDSALFVGGEQSYQVQHGDTLRLVAARFGVGPRQLARTNGLDGNDPRLRAGQELRVDNRRLLPRRQADGLLINIADRTLYQFRQGELVFLAPVALGKPMREGDEQDWRTPTGSFSITGKAKDPTWSVPLSIQEEMARNGQEVYEEVPPGEDNPLGRFVLKTSFPGIMIHSTNKPFTINSYTSHGCIRVFPAEMEQLYAQVPNKTRGEIIYQPVKVAVLQGGRVFLEVHRDIYRRFADLGEEVQAELVRRQVAGLVDAAKVAAVVKQKSGRPVEVTRLPETAATVPPGR